MFPGDPSPGLRRKVSMDEKQTQVPDSEPLTRGIPPEMAEQGERIADDIGGIHEREAKNLQSPTD